MDLCSFAVGQNKPLGIVTARAIGKGGMRLSSAHLTNYLHRLDIVIGQYPGHPQAAFSTDQRFIA